MTLKELLDLNMPNINQQRCSSAILQFRHKFVDYQILYWKEFLDIFKEFNEECDKVTRYKFEKYTPEHPKKFHGEQDITSHLQNICKLKFYFLNLGIFTVS